MTTQLPLARTRRFTRALAIAIIAAAAIGVVGGGAMSAQATSYARISGNGSSWAGNAVNQWLADVKAQGVTVDFTPDGSSSGRKNFAIGLSDFAVSEIPYKGDTGDKQDNNFPNFNYSMLPVVAGGTSFMYNLKVNGKRLLTLQLSQAAIAGIFSGQITTWNDPAIAATNPGINLPAQRITVVVRSDGSGATAQFTLWMLRQYPAAYAALCAKTGCDPSAATSYFPYQGLDNFTAQSGSNGVTTYTSNTAYTINYDEYSYALGVGFPVAKVQNAAGFYTVPTDTGVAVALTQAKINTDKTSPNYLSQDLSAVYAYKDPRTYPISAYSYMIAPSETRGNFTNAKGATLGYFSTYALCEGQRKMGRLGYSPLPMNLVLAALDQVEKIPGIDAATTATIDATRSGVASGSGNPCNNPTFKPGDDPAHNILVDSAVFPANCDASCQAPWKTAAAGTGAQVPSTGNTTTPTKPGAGTTTKPTTGATTAPTNGSTPGGTAGGGTAGGGTGTGGSTGGTSGGGTVTGGGSGAAPGAGTACDADTGVCGTTPVADGSTGGTTDGTGTTTGGTQLVASPTVLTGEAAWGRPQLAIALCAAFALLLLIVPPVLARTLDTRGRSRRSDDTSGRP